MDCKLPTFKNKPPSIAIEINPLDAEYEYALMVNALAKKWFAAVNIFSLHFRLLYKGYVMARQSQPNLYLVHE
jgi:hypothetical protein